MSDITCEKIKQLFKSYSNGRISADRWNKKLQNAVDKDKWLAQLKRHSSSINKIYTKNMQLFTDTLSPLLNNPDGYSEEIYQCVYDMTTDMYFNNYDDPFTLRMLTDFLLKHYGKSDDMERLIPLYQYMGYALQEISRTGDHEAGIKSVKYYKKIISYKEHFAEFTSDKCRKSILVAYSNLIRTAITIKNLSYNEVYRLWLEMNEFRKCDYVKKYDTKYIAQIFDFVDMDFRTYSFSDYSFDMELKDGSPSKRLNHNLQNKLHDICSDYFEKLTDEEINKLTPDLYCNYQQLLAYSGKISWYEAWKHMDTYHQEYADSNSSDTGIMTDEVGVYINPLHSMLEALNRTDIDKNTKAEICLKYCRYAVDFSKRHFDTEFSYVVNNSLEVFCFNPILLKMIKSDADKEKLIYEIMVSRHAVTYVHSLMVSKFAEAILEAVFEQCPECLIGIMNTKNADDVLRKRAKITAFTYKSAMFHDIGKNALVDIINTEHRKISDDEYNVIKRHPEQGAKYLSMNSAFKKYRDIAFGHHKFYNGNGGYPESFDNTKSKYKPIIDLITVCDCLDAATDYLGRNYHRAKDLKTVTEEFVRDSGVRYHPFYVKLIAENKKLQKRLEFLIKKERKDIYYDVYSHYFTQN